MYKKLNAGLDYDDDFGAAVSFNQDGSRLAVGSTFYGSITGAKHVGAILIFQNSRAGLKLEEVVSSRIYNHIPQIRPTKVNFGRICALNGNYLAVGAPQCSGQNGKASGAVYIFKKRQKSSSKQATWSLKKEISDQMIDFGNIRPEDHFGKSIAFEGDRLVVGAGSQQSGAVYIFQRNEIYRSWQLEQSIDQNSSFGQLPVWNDFGQVALNRDRLAIVGRNNQQEAVHIFRKEAEVWQLSQTVSADKITGGKNQQPNHSAMDNVDLCINGIDLSDDRLVVGDCQAAIVYILKLIGNDWQLEKIISEDTVDIPPEYTVDFGASVAIYKNQLLVGSPSSGDYTNSGVVVIFKKEATDWKLEQVICE